MAMNIRVNVRDVVKTFGGWSETIPTGARRGTWLSMLNMQKEIRNEIRIQNLIWTGKLLKDTRAKKISKNIFGIFMPFYGPMLDRMEPHPVWLKRGRMITQWAKDKGVHGFVMKKLSAQTGQTERGVIVHGRQFIDKPFLIASKRVRKTVEREVNKAIRRRGRKSKG